MKPILPGTPVVVTIGDKSFPATVTAANPTGYSAEVASDTWKGTFWWSATAAAYKAGSLYSLFLN